MEWLSDREFSSSRVRCLARETKSTVFSTIPPSSKTSCCAFIPLLLLSCRAVRKCARAIRLRPYPAGALGSLGSSSTSTVPQRRHCQIISAKRLTVLRFVAKRLPYPAIVDETHVRCAHGREVEPQRSLVVALT